MHKRKEIRQAIVSALINKSDCEDRIYPNRPSPLWKSELPCICVYTNSEPAAVASRPSLYDRSLSVSIEIMAEADDTMDDTLDDIAEDIEAALGSVPNQILCDANNNALDYVEIFDLAGTEMSIVQSGDHLFGSCRITLNVSYKSDLGVVPPVEGQDLFNRAVTTYMNSSSVMAIDSISLSLDTLTSVFPD